MVTDNGVRSVANEVGAVFIVTVVVCDFFDEKVSSVDILLKSFTDVTIVGKDVPSLSKTSVLFVDVSNKADDITGDVTVADSSGEETMLALTLAEAVVVVVVVIVVNFTVKLITSTFKFVVAINSACFA
uniref:Uncharacterized protein n=1 Tax=Parascaris equorum TaxID=6256 RepID=A0A914RWA6_PAREQ